jgi:hypothetical protein
VAVTVGVAAVVGVAVGAGVSVVVGVAVVGPGVGVKVGVAVGGATVGMLTVMTWLGWNRSRGMAVSAVNWVGVTGVAGVGKVIDTPMVAVRVEVGGAATVVVGDGGVVGEALGTAVGV